VQSIVEKFQSQTEARYRIAKAAFEAQDDKTQEALQMLQDRLSFIATQEIRVFPNGKGGAGVVVNVDQDTVDQNLLYMATEIVKDLALLDIRVENYKFPTKHCSECQEKITPRKKKKA
jgi:hypothetical protein